MKKLILLTVLVIGGAWLLFGAFTPPPPYPPTDIIYSEPIAGTPALIVNDPKPVMSFLSDGRVLIWNTEVITVTDQFSRSTVFTGPVFLDTSEPMFGITNNNPGNTFYDK